MHTTSLASHIREMDADELEAKASELAGISQTRPLTTEELSGLHQIQKQYQALTGCLLVIETHPQLTS